MRILAIVCNVLFWAFFCVVVVTDGLQQGADILVSLVTFLMPIFNVLVIRILASPGHGLKLLAFILNILWLGLDGWLIIDRYPSHPAEEGLVEYVAMMALTPLVSGLALYLQMKTPEPVVAN